MTPCTELEAVPAHPHLSGITPLGTSPCYAPQGSAWQNGCNERFNGTLRQEVLNAEWFTTTKQAQSVINDWLSQYNHTRPHQALNMRPLIPKTKLEKPFISGREKRCRQRRDRGHPGLVFAMSGHGAAPIFRHGRPGCRSASQTRRLHGWTTLSKMPCSGSASRINGPRRQQHPQNSQPSAGLCVLNKFDKVNGK